MVAWRIARLMRLWRSCPKRDAQLMFEPAEWHAAYILNKKNYLASRTRSTRWCAWVRLVARLGGFFA